MKDLLSTGLWRPSSNGAGKDGAAEIRGRANVKYSETVREKVLFQDAEKDKNEQIECVQVRSAYGVWQENNAWISYGKRPGSFKRRQVQRE